MKKGISLIVLVITIIVMIILAASVVITLSNTGVINRASQAVDLTNEASVQDLAALVWADAYMDNKRGTALETEVKNKLKEQGIVEDKWSITVTDTGVAVINKDKVKPTISGIWQLWYVPSYIEINETVNFTSNGGQFTSISMNGNYEYSTLRYDETSVGWSEPYAGIPGGWNDEKYALLDFGDEPQEITNELYEFLTKYAAELPTMSGIWVFNDTFTNNLDTEEKSVISFKSNNNSYNSLSYTFEIINYYMTYNGTLVWTNMADYLNDRGWYGTNVIDGWQNQAYKEIDFGEKTYVSSDYKAWIEANATKKQ